MKDHKTGHEENITRLRRIEGQVRGVQRMIDEREYCIDIITQVQAIRSALQSVSRRILNKHIEHCVFDAVQNGNKDAMEEKMAELQSIIKRMEK